MNKTSARILAVGLPLAVVAATGVGYAYWTTSGSGSVAGTAASAVAGVELTTKTPVSGLVPGGSMTVPVSAKNPNATTSVNVTTLNAGAITTDKAGCTLLVSGATASATSPASAVTIAPGATADFGSVTVSMADDPAVNQDACRGAAFTVALTAS